MKRYIEFQQIMDTMDKEGYDYTRDYQGALQNYRNRQNGVELSLQDHLKWFVHALLTCNRPWEGVVSHLEYIDTVVYGNYDPSFLKSVDPEKLIFAIEEINCGNRQIEKQMRSIKKNVEMFERIVKEYGSVDKYINSFTADKKFDLVLSIADVKGTYKMDCLGIKLAGEYLKNVGVDIIKPDLHVCRLLDRLGYIDFPEGCAETNTRLRSVFEICHEIALQYNLTDIEVDGILWQYCAEKYFECCNANPKCAQCLVANCKYRNAH